MLYVSLLVEALRARPVLMFWVAALSQGALWVLLPTLIYAAPPGEVPLVLATGHEWALGSPAGPPLAPWLAELAFDVFGHRMFGVYLLSQICVVVTFWAVFALGRATVGARHAVMAVLLMVGVTAFSLPTLDFGPAVLAMPLIALCVLHLWRALGETRRHYWYAVGIELGLLLLTNYAGLIFVVLIALFLAATRRGRVVLRTLEPWIAALIMITLALPHLIWLGRTGPGVLANFAGLPRRLIADGQTLAWVRLVGGLVAVHGGMLVLLVVAGGLRVGPRAPAPAFERDPPPPLAKAFVYYFALTPGLVATVLAAVFATPMPFGAAGPLVIFSGLAVVMAAGDVIHLYRQRIVGVAWLALLAAPLAVTLSAVALGPWTFAVDLETGRPAAAMADFFTDSFQRRTGRPLRIVAGGLDNAGLVAVYSPDRPSLYLVDAPERTPWVTDKDMRENGAIIIWPSGDTAGTPPPAITARFPDLVPEVPRSFERPVQGRLPLLRLGWALIRPGAGR
ncbi:MAG: glycosyltransferase family 39 protein [Hyphomicrobiales bacterium]|nr:glycosyltransferase family 39 protein [Hyphomicrobiales bacterium]MBV9427824.1 glycosyltransferase family 39 protein [Bradyrhizobiaceae bacterium]